MSTVGTENSLLPVSSPNDRNWSPRRLPALHRSPPPSSATRRLRRPSRCLLLSRRESTRRSWASTHWMRYVTAGVPPSAQTTTLPWKQSRPSHERPASGRSQRVRPSAGSGSPGRPQESRGRRHCLPDNYGERLRTHGADRNDARGRTDGQSRADSNRRGVRVLSRHCLI